MAAQASLAAGGKDTKQSLSADQESMDDMADKFSQLMVGTFAPGSPVHVHLLLLAHVVLLLLLTVCPYTSSSSSSLPCTHRTHLD